ncbi:MAG: hypothetical protein ACOVP7_02740 [Lacibacter sp.]
MKNKIIFLSVLMAAAFAGTGCGGDCATTDCGNPKVPLFSFRLLNNNGKDLLGGTTKIYDSANVKILAKRADNGLVENINRTFNIIADTNYITAIAVSQTYSVYYLSLNNTVTDSLFFGYNKRQTECCDESFYSLNKINTAALTPIIGLPYNSYPIVK